MKKNSALNTLLRKANRLHAQIQKMVNDPYYWRPGYEKRYDALYEKKWALRDEFAAIGYKFDTCSFEVTEIA